MSDNPKRGDVLLPFEVAGLWRHPRLGCLLLLLGNLAVAIYLGLRVLRRR